MKATDIVNDGATGPGERSHRTDAGKAESSVSLAHAAPTHSEFRHERLAQSWEGGKWTNTEARAIVANLLGWARQFNHPEAVQLTQALSDVDGLFVRVWTEIDESLQLLSHANSLSRASRDPERAEEFRQTAMSYLHRWQDRQGRIGNASNLRGVA